MYRILKELIGKNCSLMVKSGDGFLIEKVDCTVLDCDSKMIKIKYHEKKKGDIIKILRIENIVEIYINEKIEEI